jgi:hypothetical protein
VPLLATLVLLTSLVDARALVRAGVTENDRPKIVEGVTAYYNITPENAPPPLIVAAFARLRAARDNDELSRALLGVRFPDEAALVAPPDSAVATYTAMLQRMRDVVSAHYRRKFAPGALQRELARELRTLWPKLSFDEARAQMEQQYGGVVILRGDQVLIAHKIRDESLLVDQYGYKGKVRFVVLDGFVTNDERNVIGGLEMGKVIYQVRPPFVDLMLRQWQRVSSGKKLAGDEDTVENAGRRLYDRYLEQVLAETKTQEAFLARVERDQFEFSMILHEGRHAIDEVLHQPWQPWEGEYRAKLSQVALTSGPVVRVAAADVLSGVKDQTPHGRANAQLVRDLARWMKANTPDLGGITRFDRLTDDQIRAAFRSLDPLAKAKR